MVISEEVIRGALKAWNLFRDCQLPLESRSLHAYPPDLITRLREVHPDSDDIRYKLALGQLCTFYQEHCEQTEVEAIVQQLIDAEINFREVGKKYMPNYGAPDELDKAGEILDTAQRAVDSLLGNIRVTRRRICRDPNGEQSILEFLELRRQAHAALFVSSQGGEYNTIPAIWKQSH